MLIFVQGLRGAMVSILVCEEFAGVVARVESLQGRMSEGERQVEGLFESLLAESLMVMRRGDSSMPSVVMSSKEVLPDQARVSPRRVAPTVAFAGVVVS